MHESLDQEIQTLQSIFWSERDPDGLAFASLADAFRRKGEVREALDLLTDGMSRHPDFVTGHAIAATLYRDLGMDFEAELAARRVLELDPENLVGLSALADLLAAKGETGEAERLRDSVRTIDPDSDEARAFPGTDHDPGDPPPEPTELLHESMDDGLSTEPLLDDLVLEHRERGYVDAEVADDDLAAAMDSLGLVGENEAARVAEPPQDVLPGPEMEFEDLAALAPDEPEEAEPEAMDLAALAPDEPEEAEPEAMDLAALAPDGPEEAEPEAMDLAALAPDEPEEAEPEAMDLAALAPDEPEEAEPEAMDVAALAPDEPEEAEPEAMDLATLAPDEPEEAEPEAIDLATLAPDEPEEAEPEAMDLAALAPDEPEEAEPEAMDLAALAPDEPEEAEPEAMDLAALAPDEPEEAEPEAMDLAALAPDEPEEAEPEAMDLAALAPDEPEEAEPEAMDLSALAPDEPETRPAVSDEPAEPIYTRTLADLYIKQGFDDKALEVLKALQARNPDDDALAERIATLEAGGTPEIKVPKAQIPGDGHSEDEVEARARELAEHGQDGPEAVDTPFAWNTDGSEDGEPDEPPVGNYFDTLLAWEDRAEP